ncbi:MAG: hypothetical protein Q7S40_06635 [Opitutaceae bacterium]|nr:hypothetical protein [Opitutaceae bacterium]
MPDVFTETVPALLRAARDGGATPEALSVAFLTNLEKVFGPTRAKETSAMLGFRKLLGADGGSVNAADATKLYGGPVNCTEEAVRKAARGGQLISVRDGLGNVLFPVWQFSPRGGALPGLREVLAILRRHPHFDDLLPFTFFLNPTARLNGRSPVAALRDANVEPVLRLASELAE